MTLGRHDFNLFTFDTSILVVVFIHILTFSLFILSLFSFFFSIVCLSLFISIFLYYLILQLLAFFKLTLHNAADKGRWKSCCWVASEVHLLWCDRPAACFKCQLLDLVHLLYWNYVFVLVCAWSHEYPELSQSSKSLQPRPPSRNTVVSNTCSFLLFLFQRYILCPLLIFALHFCHHLSHFHLLVLNRNIPHFF